MTDLLQALQHFHFLRPWWLAAIPVMALLWWRIRPRSGGTHLPATGVAPHLARALTVGAASRARVCPIDGVALTVTLLALAAAGPTWNRVPNPLVADTAPLVIALEVSESMLASDVAPSRLERAKQKILDLLAVRAGARTALVAYAGTAHLVVPLTEDAAVLKPFLEGLAPEVMPRPGANATAALDLARAALAAEDVPGAVLFVLDDLDAADRAAFAGGVEDQPPVVFLTVGAPEAAGAVRTVPPSAEVIAITADRADVDAVTRHVAAAYREALAEDERQAWEDRAWILAWPAALLMLAWFRRGWTMRWAVILAAAWVAQSGDAARADGIADWFLTPDQQGRLAYADKAYGRAAELFEDPMWRGQALYRDGQYQAAAETFARLPTAEAAFAEGMAHIKARAYPESIAAFETALARDPASPAAARNLGIARAILAYVETTREQSGTDEGSEGAGEVAFDKEAAGGAETVLDAGTEMKLETAAQWMRSVDTRTADFLRTRFALEAAEARR